MNEALIYADMVRAGGICYADTAGAYFQSIVAAVLQGKGEWIAFCNSGQINAFHKQPIQVNKGCIAAFGGIHQADAGNAGKQQKYDNTYKSP